MSEHKRPESPDDWRPCDEEGHPVGSAITWVVGDGHVSLDEARRRSLDEYADAERDLIEARARWREASEAVRRSIRQRSAEEEAVKRAEAALNSARNTLLSRFPTPPPVERSTA